MRRDYLLPHTCQRIGGWMLVLAVGLAAVRTAASLTTLWPKIQALKWAGGSYGMTLSALITFALLLIAFSKEREEDEMIDAVRKRSVVNAAYLLFLLYLLTTLVFSTYIHAHAYFCIGPDTANWKEQSMILRKIADTIKDPATIFILYEAVFRTRLMRLKKALKNEE